MSSRYLFFDDDKVRHRGFSIKNIGRLVDHVYSAQECIRALRDRYRYNRVYLDHDMDQNEFNQDETGTTVAEYIQLHLERDKYPDHIIIHSHNKEAAQRMHSILIKTGIPIHIIPYKPPYMGFGVEET